MQTNHKVYKPFIMGLLVATLGVCFSLDVYAQQNNFLPSLKSLINSHIVAHSQTEENFDPKNLPPVIFYSPETGEEETIDLYNLSNSVEDVEPITPIIEDEENGNISENNLSAPAELQTYSGKSDLRKFTDSRVILLEIEMGSTKSKKKTYGYCSGAMISRYTVLTAAHCLRGLKKGGTIKAYTGGKNAKYTSYKEKTWYPKLFTQWIPSIDFQVDYGYVVLKDPLGDYVGTFGGRNPTLVVGDKITAYGFPACSSYDKPSISEGYKIALPKGGDIIQLLLSLFDKYGSFRHNAYIDNGMSGGPIFEGKNLSQIVAVTSHYWAPIGKTRQFWATGSGLGFIKGLVIDRRDKESKSRRKGSRRR